MLFFVYFGTCTLTAQSSIIALKGGERVAKTRAEINNAYAKKAYDDIRLQVPKGQKEIIREHAQTKGETLGGFIKRAINETMEREKEG